MMADGILDFFSREAGQRRRRDLEDAITYYIPPELRGLLGAVAEANPVVSAERAGQDAQVLFAPDQALMDRLAAGGRMASNMAGVVAPAAVAGRAGVPAAAAVMEGLLGGSPAQQAAADMARGFVADESGALRLSPSGPDLEPFANMTREEFIGSPRITGPSNASSLKPKALRGLEDVEAVDFPVGNLKARYDDGAAAVYDGDKVVASYNFGDTLVVDPKYRRKGIGEELVYQWRTRFPAPAATKTRTSISQRIQENVWERIQRELGQAQANAPGLLSTPTDPAIAQAEEVLRLPPASNAQRTQIAGTFPTYQKALGILDTVAPQGRALDFGAGLGMSRDLGFDTFEPFPRAGFDPTYRSAADIPDASYDRLTNLNVLNVVPREVRDSIVQDIGRVLRPGGAGVITTRGRDVLSAKGMPGPEPMSVITSADTYQKGFTQSELQDYLRYILGNQYEVSPLRLGPAGAMIRRNR